MAHSPRPTLPPLHSLHLPREHACVHDLDDRSPRTPQFELSPHYQPHQGPISPPAPSPRTPSPPVPCLRTRTNAPTSTPSTPDTPFPARKVRLVPTSFENADAVVLVPPPNAPNAPPPQPLLIVGPALARLRHPQRQVAKGVRIHPYRITRPPAGPSLTQA